jgi:hypothetical protein
MTHRAGILAIMSFTISRAFAPRILPPDHRIIASREDDQSGLIEYYIEGPDLPELSDSPSIEPARICIELTMETVGNGRFRLTGSWMPCDTKHTWTIGEWGSLAEYNAIVSGNFMPELKLGKETFYYARDVCQG